MLPSLIPNDVSLLLRLIVAHVVADFALQTHSRVEERIAKKWASRWLNMHGALAGILAYAFAGRWRAAWLPVIVFASHVLIDGLKSRGGDTARSLLLDQLGHVLIILGCWVLLADIPLTAISTFLVAAISHVELWILILAYAVAIWPAGIWISTITEPWRQDIQGEDSSKLGKAGLWIGRLERILILTFVFSRHFEAIGFLIAAKSLFRFGETRASDRRKEYE